MKIRRYVQAALFLGVALFLMAGAANASTLYQFCSPASITTIVNGTPGTGLSVTCGPSNLPSIDFITGVDLWITQDYSYGSSGSNTLVTTFTPTAGFVGSPESCSTTGASSSAGSACSFTGLPSGVEYASTSTGAALQTLGTTGIFTVGISAAVTAGTINAASAGVMVEYDYNSPVPEPATFGLIGSALLGLGVLGRKFARR
jgi:hypothetical protein